MHSETERVSVYLYVCFFFFKQKTAYEMRISDWSSDVCSSDLTGRKVPRPRCARSADRFASMAIHDHQLNRLDGGTLDLHDYDGKALLIVNVASKCGLTPQYAGLEKLHEQYSDRGFPENGRASRRDSVCRYV